MDVETRIKIVEKNIKCNESYIPNNANKEVQVETKLIHSESRSNIVGDPNFGLEDNDKLVNGSNKSRCIGEDVTDCPKCNAQVSPFNLPEHLDMHLAREIHKEIQEDLRKNRDLLKNETKRSDESKKRKYPPSESNAKDCKRQTDIKNFFNKK